MTGADGGAGLSPRPEWRWDVALSFASAQRDYVEQVAQVLTAQGVRCFYDADEQIELWGKYLAEELPNVYGEQAAVVRELGNLLAHQGHADQAELWYRKASADPS